MTDVAQKTDPTSKVGTPSKKVPRTPSKSTPKKAADSATKKGGDMPGRLVEQDPNPIDSADDAATETTKDTESLADDTNGVADDVKGTAEETADEAGGTVGDAAETAGETAEGAVPEDDDEEEAVPVGKVDKEGNVIDDEGNPIGKVDDMSDKIVGSVVDQEGDILDEEGNVIGGASLGDLASKAGGAASELGSKVGEAKDDATEKAGSAAGGLADKAQDAPGGVIDLVNAKVQESGDIVDEDGKVIAKVPKEDVESLQGKTIKRIDENGNIVDEEGNIIGKAEIQEAGKELAEKAGEAAEGVKDLSILKGLTLNKIGNVVDSEGVLVGKLVEGDPKKLVGKKVDDKGQVWDEEGKVIGKVDVVDDLTKPLEEGAFADFPDAVVDMDGNVKDEKGNIIGKLVEGDADKLAGKKVDEDGDILDKNGNVLGKAARLVKEIPAEEAPKDLSILDGCKVNKVGNVVNDSGKVVGKLIEGDAKKLAGKTCDEQGQIYNDKGKVIGKATVLEDTEKDDSPEGSFADLQPCVVGKDGFVKAEDGTTIGKLIEGDAKKLAGKKVDEDGDVIDKNGNVVGKCERWEEEEVVPEAIDYSILAGKRVNKAGNVVDDRGSIFGKLIEGDAKKCTGRMCDKDGNVRGEDGSIIGKAEPIPEGQREAVKEGPFSDFTGLTVRRDGKVTDSKDQVVGRLIEGDAKKLAGRLVDEDGEVIDKNGNSIGKAERWEEEEKVKEPSFWEGRSVNKSGEVFSAQGDLIGKLTEGDQKRCAGHEIDEDGDIVDAKGKVIGHVTKIDDIEVEVEKPVEKSPEELEAEKTKEEDRKVAKRMASVIAGAIEKMNPILKMITELTEKADRTPKEDLDEQKLVDDVKPLIEQGGNILQEVNGAIRALDPDGAIAERAKANSAHHEATPEEYHLAELLKELTGNVTQTIDKAKKRIADMPHAKKELNPLWGLLSEPLFQILAAVGLLLSGVLGLVGKLLNGLGLGGLVNNLLGGLGLTKVLDNLGIGQMLGLGGDKKKK